MLTGSLCVKDGWQVSLARVIVRSSLDRGRVRIDHQVMSVSSLRVRQRTENRALLWVPCGMAVIWLATFGVSLVFAGVPPWMRVAAAAAHVAVALAFTWAANELLRVWGTATRARACVVGVGMVAALAAAVGFAEPGRLPAIVGGATWVALVVIYLWPEQAAERLPRSPVWEVLHRVSAVSARAEPLAQDEAVARAPEFVRMIEGAQRFRTDETAAYLDLFVRIADADLALAPEPEDRAALDARWQILHRELADKFAPFSTWRVAPDPVAHPLGAGA